jgi:predicted lipoprotein with Yx(FWY)xxD motif
MKKIAVMLLASVLAVGVAGCSEDSKPAAGAQPGETAASPSNDNSPQPTPTARPEPISLAVTTAQVKGTQAEVVTVNGWTAYRFEADEDQPSKVNCLNDCLVTWPPALTDGSQVQVSGIDPALVSTVKRADGLTQVTLRGWPLYKFVEDKAKSDTKGEGVGGNWSAVKPDGKPVFKKS